MFRCQISLLHICHHPHRTLSKYWPVRSFGHPLQSHGEYVVHIMNEWYLDAANHCSGNFASDTNEQSVAGLTPTASKVVKPPRIQESAFHMECKLVDTYEVPDRKTGQVNATMVIGEVVMFHVKMEVASESPSGSLVVDITKGYKPMSRLGGNMYGTVGDIVDIPRPKV
ncbi:hypothetical protein SARC_07700 [Sphaeroforma arctica JP610]|uniref:Flavin reductase like domain-containing protein n=1 Tax=Sphaeroforma arctica JP610 TaxID=667725 RepID=A0A0L0FT03_9EUKA|nr:hypothetical protein SARC_07700 [Sphaeroforma arctica JP610]KNC79920.1 hypothetical protein SARC_07700 [Sphaeroforma arctica JP610]|eukprot:XP_014153822.1 hypothetical protein SARC_07700 [Sphaeroforma arctica JP610]